MLGWFDGAFAMKGWVIFGLGARSNLFQFAFKMRFICGFFLRLVSLFTSAVGVALGFGFSGSVQTLRLEGLSIDSSGSFDIGGGTASNAEYRVSGTLQQPQDFGTLGGVNFALQGGILHDSLAVPHGDMPLLVLASVGKNVLLSWSMTTPGFVLEMSGTVAPPVWTNAPGGAWSPVTIPALGERRLFRLKRL